MDTIIANGTIVTATDTYRADLGLTNGQIEAIGRDLARPAGVKVIDAAGKYVMPGGIDTHTHLDSRSQTGDPGDDFRTGTIAAACGGTTSIVDMSSQAKGKTPLAMLADYQQRASGRSVIDYGFHCTIGDPTPATFAELTQLPDHGVTSFKVFLAYKGRTMVDDYALIQVLDRARQVGVMTMVHAENGELVEYLQNRLVAEGKTAPKYHAASRPPRVEAEATNRAISLAEMVGAPVYIVHVSCREALEEVTRGRQRGVTPVFAETCPQYLTTTEADLERPNFEGAKWVFTPPPRTADQQTTLWQALARGDLQAVASDHAPHPFASAKQLGRDSFVKIPNGAPGIEERLMVVYQGVNNGWLSLNRFVDIVSTGPAKMFGLFPRKGAIAIGSDADLVLWDPNADLTITNSALHHRMDYTLQEGRRVRGIPHTVLRRGTVIVENRQFVGGEGGGMYLRRGPTPGV